MSKVFITSALPYANGPCHLGHLRSTYIPADIYARYNRMKGRDVLFVCATDEHGTPIAVRAEQEGKQPIEVAGRYYEMIKKDLDACSISLDNFSRTTDPKHYEISQNFFLKLYEKGYIYEKIIKQPYCKECARFLPDRYVEGKCPNCGGEARGDHCETCGRHLEPTQVIEPTCLICKSTPEIRESKQYFFELSKFQDELNEWIQSNDQLPPNVKNYALQWLKEGLKDWILTRDMEWGIPVPLEDAEGKIIYVWGEAFLGYISSAAQWSEKTGKPWEDYWNDKAVHFIGKDIIYHHSIFWPALLMAYGCKLPYTIIAGEYLSLEGMKMSTSKNWVIWASDFLETFDSDTLRYYLIANAPLTRDTDFSWEDFQRRVNDELADVLGNFLHRTFTFTTRFFDGKIPEPSDFDEYDKEFESKIKALPEIVGNYIEKFKFREGLIEITKLAKYGNKYFNDKEPWKTVKTDKKTAGNCLYLSNQLAKTMAVTLIPYMPVKTLEIFKTLNMNSDINWDNAADFIPSGHELGEANPIFLKVEDDVIKNEKQELYKNLKDVETMKDEISIDDFAAMDLRVGKVVGAENVKKSDNLLKLMVDIGEKQLQVVAGVAKKYSPEEVLNRTVIVLVNLPPAKLFGIKSEGMLLATDNNMSLLTVEDADIGEKIK
ncbi:methionine--tRNA ligase [Methanobacterium spitsbergense]|uniref:Methionine--tRNA ligase n=1 Tax=Methanobacterium spitsbergense TaxID=2874285 RepID=A0A8T5UZF3_9EURY|nr:methionine--tRNA ligase [Methanobacterium spitsbergense]MBZ2166550.1 methionine--tRNA ligase [Methanobacterium spitsbergense]